MIGGSKLGNKVGESITETVSQGVEAVGVAVSSFFSDLGTVFG